MRKILSSNGKIRYSNYYILNFMITLLVIIFSLLFLILKLPYETALLFFAWTGNSILLWGIYLFKKIKGTHINQYTFFFLSYYFFSYGQVFLYSLGIEYQKFNLIRIFPSENIIAYCLFFCVGTCFLLMGALIAIRKDTIIEQRISSIEYKDGLALNKSIKIVAWVMFIISAPLYLQDLISNMITSINYGYRSIYETTSSSPLSNIVDSLGMWFIPSLFMLLVVYKHNKYMKYFTILILFFTSLGIFIIGSRSRSIAIIISLIYLWNAEIKRFQKKDKILLVLGIIFIFSLLPVIQNFRGSQFKSLDGFLYTFRTMYINNNLMVDIIGELGGSMQPWLLVNDLIPQVYSYRLGQSYISSFLAIIPSVLLGGFSFTKYAHLSGWLQDAANMSYGPGFSILAEAFYNFGWLGIPIMIIIGWLYYKFLSNNMLKGSIVAYKNVFSAIALYAFITSARGSLYLSIRTEVYAIILPMVVIRLIYNSNIKASNHRERV